MLNRVLSVIYFTYIQYKQSYIFHRKIIEHNNSYSKKYARRNTIEFPQQKIHPWRTRLFWWHANPFSDWITLSVGNHQHLHHIILSNTGSNSNFIEKCNCFPDHDDLYRIYDEIRHIFSRVPAPDSCDGICDCDASCNYFRK